MEVTAVSVRLASKGRALQAPPLPLPLPPQWTRSSTRARPSQSRAGTRRVPEEAEILERTPASSRSLLIAAAEEESHESEEGRAREEEEEVEGPGAKLRRRALLLLLLLLLPYRPPLPPDSSRAFCLRSAVRSIHELRSRSIRAESGSVGAGRA